MATSATSRTATCYHCRRQFDVPLRAMSISCPWCSRRVTLDDLVVRDRCWTSRLQTCGRIFIDRNGLVNARVIEAMEGIEIQGTVEGNLVSGGPVIIGPGARVKGDLAAPSIHITAGAIIDGGMLRIASALPPAWDAPRPIARPGSRPGDDGRRTTPDAMMRPASPVKSMRQGAMLNASCSERPNPTGHRPSQAAG